MKHRPTWVHVLPLPLADLGLGQTLRASSLVCGGQKAVGHDL